jgi:hypothetical protein
MVVFCTKHANSTIAFRPPVLRDFLGSGGRKQWIPPKDRLELFYADVVGEEVGKGSEKDDALILRRGREEMLERYHPASASGHWAIMRTVIPPAVWELF